MTIVAMPLPGGVPAETPPLTRLQSDLVARIVATIRREELAPGTHLTELGLSNLFGVSRSPVREALRHLTNRGVMRFEEKRGYFLLCPLDELDKHLKGLAPSPEEALYDQILQERAARALGDSFTASELMRRYDCGRPLLLRVLTRLTEEGILKAGRGYVWSFLPALDDDEAVAESYRLRLLLEPAGLLEPTFVLDRSRLERSLAAQEAVVASGAADVTSLQMFEINAEFHELLARCSGNRFILQNLQHQNRLRRLNEYLAFSDQPRMVISCREHIAIIKALLKDEREHAADLLRAHLSGAMTYGR